MNKRRQFLRHGFSAARSQNPDRQYEFYKEQWRLNHPDATPEQYAAAMQEIARKLGI
jgi:hypothetical protein